MPAYNGMGPQGAGPMTGWGRGYCMTYINRGAGFVPGYGRGSWCRADFGRPQADAAGGTVSMLPDFPAGQGGCLELFQPTR